VLTRTFVFLLGFVELKEAEHAHRDAVGELEKMRDAMVKMEQERLEMVAEVEAQIERALASMQIEVLSDVSEYSDDSRPHSRMSDPTITRRPITPGTPRKGSAGEKRLRSYGTESTLVDYDDDSRFHAADRSTTVIEETEEEPEKDERRKGPGIDDVQEIPDEDVTIVKRFSAEANRRDKNHQDAMGAVDMGISEKSDKIAQKVMEIQRKVST
jgi:nicotinamide N-methyltransferase